MFVALDTPTWVRLGVAEKLARSARDVIVIDHHADDACFGHLNLVDPTAAATASIIWRLLPLLGVQPTPAIAAACYVGLMTDTGRFSYGNTTPRAARRRRHDRGGRRRRVACRKVYESRTAPALALLGRVLSRITLANGGRVVYSWIGANDLAETGALAEETENLVDAVRQTGGVDAVVIFKEGRRRGEGVAAREVPDAGCRRRRAVLRRRRPLRGRRRDARDSARRRHQRSPPRPSRGRGVKRRGATTLAGILLVDKPAGMTSHDVVAIVRRETGEGRVGHAGTLDPMATGLLVVLIGPYTRLEPYLSAARKSYEARIVFGAETDTDDAEGAVVRTADVPDDDR